VIVGNDIMLLFKLNVPAIKVDQVEEIMSRFKLINIKKIIADNVHAETNHYEYITNYKELKNLLCDDINTNLKIIGKHSTIGQILIHIKSDIVCKKGVYTKQPPIPMNQVEFVKEQLVNWLAEGIIRKQLQSIKRHIPTTTIEIVTGLFNTPMMVVTSGKKLRLVGNYIKVNDITKDDLNDVSSINAIFLQIDDAKPKVFSCINLRWAFL
jgi:hypothetical protein